MKLSQDQKEKLTRYFSQFEGKLKKELAAEWRKERTEREKWFKKAFSKPRLKQLTKEEFSKIITSLWASNIWGNKEYHAQDIIKKNSLAKIIESFEKLLYGDDDLTKRYDTFKSSIKGIGDSSLTEIITFVDPKKYCIWNNKPKAVLPFLGLDKTLPARVFRYGLSGGDYVQCVEILEAIGQEMKNFGFDARDFLDVDILMWVLFEGLKIEKRKEVEKEKPAKEEAMTFKPADLDHWDAIALIAKLGDLLGFDVYVANPSYKSKVLNSTLGSIAKPASELPEELRGIKDIERVDAIWIPFAGAYEKIYLFEIEDRGTMREALHRLSQALLLDAKMFVVGPKENEEKFERWADTHPFNSLAFRNKCKYKNFEELVKVYQRAKEYFEVKREFLGE